jgi:hypothetical protein
MTTDWLKMTTSSEQVRHYNAGCADGAYSIATINADGKRGLYLQTEARINNGLLS